MSGENGLDEIAPLTSRTVETRVEQRVCLHLYAHNSLNARQARWFLLTVAVGPSITAGYCVWLGFWPVLPFAGLEFVLLILALRWSMQRGRQWQRIEITATDVVITRLHGAEEITTRFPRHWTSVRLSHPRSALHPCRLLLESSGRACEVGGFLTEDERRALAARLTELVGKMNDSPRL
jgi:uncharacterized membrane protein